MFLFYAQLGAIRTFINANPKIPFVFTGKYGLGDKELTFKLAETQGIQIKTWATFFIHAHHIKVPYLNKDAVWLLYDKSVELHFPEEIREQIWMQTCGHPLLSQIIGYHIVNTFNEEFAKSEGDLEKLVTQALLDKVIDLILSDKGMNLTAFMREFWTVEHNTDEEHDFLRKVLHHPITKQEAMQLHRDAYIRLNNLDYLSETTDGYLSFKVPLYRNWLIHHIDSL